jgi:hypothetical protein
VFSRRWFLDGLGVLRVVPGLRCWALGCYRPLGKVPGTTREPVSVPGTCNVPGWSAV